MSISDVTVNQFAPSSDSNSLSRRVFPRNAQCAQNIFKVLFICISWNLAKSDNFERTFWFPRILPKNEQCICLSSKNEFVCSFFGRIRGYQKSFPNYLTFSVRSKKLHKIKLFLKKILNFFFLNVIFIGCRGIEIAAKREN